MATLELTKETSGLKNRTRFKQSANWSPKGKGTETSKFSYHSRSAMSWYPGFIWNF